LCKSCNKNQFVADTDFVCSSSSHEASPAKYKICEFASALRYALDSVNCNGGLNEDEKLDFVSNLILNMRLRNKKKPS